MEFKQSQTLQHYNKDCQEIDGIACEAAPYCKVIGTRGYIANHEIACGMIKVECSRCQQCVVRKYIGQHDCFESVKMRLDKLYKTETYVL